MQTIGNAVLDANPFRYRGYYFDNETGFYYLNSRYYDPQVGRFLNADDPTMLFETAGVAGGANLYAYCLNNPVMYYDPTGEIAFVPILLWVGGAALVGVTAYSIVDSAISFYNDPSLENAGALLWEVFPFGKAARVADKFIGVAKLAKRADNVTDVGKAAKRFNTDQKAVIDLAKQAKKAGGITRQNADTLVKWAKQYGIDAHGPMKHFNRPNSIWSKVEHINVHTYHIQILF